MTKIGCWAAFWGDTRSAVAQLLRVDDLDYLVSDYLAEITMALLARARAKDPAAGFVPDAIAALKPYLTEISERGITVVTNAGALNPAACAAAFEEAVKEAGLDLKVAAVTGDDLLPKVDELVGAGAKDMFTGEPLPADVSTMNAYLGARPIATALAAGADIVVTGRCVDAAVVLGPLMHEFGWSDDDHDLLAAGSLVGHIVECGPQCAGGTFTDWSSVPGWEDMGYPIAEVEADGTVTITKAPGTGGLVTPGTVGEQILYEIGDPGAYVMPEVVCDWREVALEQVGPDRVRASGAKGSAPTGTYKVTATHQDGYRAVTTAMFAGYEAAGRARRAGEAIFARSERLLAEKGLEPFRETSLEVVGGGDIYGEKSMPDAATEVVVKLGVLHAERAGVEVFSGEYVPTSLVAQGMTGFFAGRPRPAPVFRVIHLLVDKGMLEPRVTMAGEDVPLSLSPGNPDAKPGTAVLDEPKATLSGTTKVPLKRLAYGRSGDKGNLANIGLIARRPEFAATIAEQVTAARVGSFFAHNLRDDAVVKRWAVPGLDAINIVMTEVLGGTGGTSTLRYDPQAKSYAAMLLTMPIEVDAEVAALLEAGR
ncbi:MAG: DUF1446 domain-containing protein [Actinobacteria bacterium]|nr:DUF1446 domain-containing protein [Actinomycetota bacterium]